MAHLSKSDRENIKELISLIYKKAGRSWGDNQSICYLICIK